ncbi:hypothetical protein EJ04DRAFT_560864 [Polyplosphaeria fusca]|uniref:SAP domain-containing protein n=1 Tax=Polyplosphaeria fusca TaxID=682080 RepID=A0A9P4R7J8_9PLEO|nr:hypothetical protein EJ04DRAFT_560864 [Polyplosphaeria fusca]
MATQSSETDAPSECKDAASKARLATMKQSLSERSVKFYDGTYKSDANGFTDEHGVTREWNDTESTRAPTPLPYMSDAEEDKAAGIDEIPPGSEANASKMIGDDCGIYEHLDALSDSSSLSAAPEILEDPRSLDTAVDSAVKLDASGPVQSPASDAKTPYADLTYRELQKRCRERNLKSGGGADMLRDRLQDDDAKSLGPKQRKREDPKAKLDTPEEISTCESDQAKGENINADLETLKGTSDEESDYAPSPKSKKPKRKNPKAKLETPDDTCETQAKKRKTTAETKSTTEKKKGREKCGRMVPKET